MTASPGLKRLFAPRHMAVIGGGAWARGVIAGARLAGFEGEIWPVHPTASAIEGLPAVACVADLPYAPDAAFVAVNRTATIAVVADLAQMGAGGAVCFAAGFAEAVAELPDGAALQAALLAAAGEMPFLGPNCYGFVNYLDRAALWPDQHGGRALARGVGVIAQSSNIALNLTMQRRGVPLAQVVTLGNQAQQGLASVGMAMLDDPRISALGLYIEGIGDLRGFEALCARARALGKPVIALKIGRSAQGAAGAVSHTAALAGQAAGATALFERLGVCEVRDLETLLEALKLAHVTGGLGSARVVSASCSGGEAGMMADLGQAAGVAYPPLGPAREVALRGALGGRVALANPLDYNTYVWGDVPAMTAVFEALAGPDVGLVCIVLDLPRADRCDASAWAPTVAALQAAADRVSTPLALLVSLPDCLPEDLADRLIEAGIVPLVGMGPALAAIAACQRPSAQVPEPLAYPRAAAAPDLMSEAAAKAALSRFGVCTPPGWVVDCADRGSGRSAQPGALNSSALQGAVDSGALPGAVKSGALAGAVATAVAAAEALGYPVVLKAQGLAHKTDTGAVALGLGTAADVAQAVRRMAAGSYLIEAMVAEELCELLVGVTVDPAHGILLTLGAGGTRAELSGDRVHMLMPVTAAQIRAGLGRLRIAPVLAGYRGAPGADMDRVVAAVLGVQDFVLAHPGRVAEVEINPLMVTGDAAIAADALIRIGDRDA